MSKKKISKKTSMNGSVCFRGSTWSYVVRVTDPKTGKKKQKWVSGFSTQQEAKQAQNKARAQIRLGEYQEPSKQTVCEYITSWFEDVHKPHIKPGTARGYEVNIRVHIVPAIGHIKLDKLNRQDVQRMCNNMQKGGSSAATIRYALRVLSASLNEAVLNDFIQKNPCKGIRITGRKFKPVLLDKDQIVFLLAEAETTSIGLEILLAATLGLRRGELLGLRYSDFDFLNGTVHIQNQYTVVKSSREEPIGVTEWGMSTLKTEESNRILYLPKTVIEAVEARQRESKFNRLKLGSQYRNQDLVCCDEQGVILNPHTLYTKYKNLLKKLNLPDVRFHDLRHSYASIMIEENVPLKTVSHMLGHANISTTADIYCDVLSSHKEAAKIAENCFFPQSVTMN